MCLVRCGVSVLLCVTHGRAQGIPHHHESQSLQRLTTRILSSPRMAAPGPGSPGLTKPHVLRTQRSPGMLVSALKLGCPRKRGQGGPSVSNTRVGAASQCSSSESGGKNRRPHLRGGVTRPTLAQVTAGSPRHRDACFWTGTPAAADPSLFRSPREFDTAAVQTLSPLPGRRISKAIQQVRDTFRKSRAGRADLERGRAGRCAAVQGPVIRTR